MRTKITKRLQTNMKSLQKFGCRIPQRYVLTLLAFFALFNAFAMRANLSIAITKMVAKPQTVNVTSTDDPDRNETISDQTSLCQHRIANDVVGGSLEYRVNSIMEHYQLYRAHDQFEWSEHMQGIILSSFYWGYTLSHFPGGFLVQKYGGKYVLAFGILFSGVLSMAIPICVQYGGAHSLIALRVLMGISQGPIIPACLSLFSSWIPLTERCTIVSMAYGGVTVGTIVGTFVSGFLIHYYETWRSAFYFFGLMAIIWFFFFIILCYSTPVTHPFIDDTEKSYLASEVDSQIDGHYCDHHIIPWKAMLSSGPVLALIFTQLAQDWGFFVTEIYLPKYLNDILGVSIQNNGILSSIPHVAELVLLCFVGLISDCLIANNILSITNTRKVFVVFASIIAATFFIAASYAECDQTLVILYFTIAVSSHCLTTSGTLVNSLDLTAHYVGPLSSIVNGLGSFVGIITPYTIGHLTPSAHLSEWRIVFWITFAVYIISIVVFTAFGSGNLQPWDGFEHRTDNDVRVMNWLNDFYKVLMFLVISSIILLIITYI